MVLNSTIEGLETIKHATGTSQRTAALITGISLLLMTVLAMFANFFVIEGLIVPGNAALTAENILNNEALLRWGIFSLMLVIILDIIVAWSLTVFLRPVNWSLSLLGGWFRLVYSAIFFVALVSLVNGFNLVTAAAGAGLFTAEQVPAQMMLAINSFSAGWDAGLAIFGLHLVIVGYLIFKSGNMPKILGLLVIICGAGYTIDTFTALLIPDFGISLSLFTFFGEILLAIWLLVKGLQAKAWENGMLKSS
ncbi:MAG: DUF4386 domain-containing protein [Candidatus Promineifilaceae bacterium]|jgi:hypothetical protein